MAFKILVVDDEPDVELLIRQSFRRKIRDGEFAFEFALNGEEALQKLAVDESIDIIMSDINMPVMDGLTLLSKISGLDRVVRTVMVSAYGDMQNIRIAMNRGAYDFLTKPIDFDDFEVTIQKTIQEIKTIRAGHNARKQLDAIETELSVASRIQQSMLPRRFPAFPDRPEFDVYAEMQPAHMVGGDFYDFFLVDSNRFGFVIADVSGKGVPAALSMAATRTLLRATAMQGAAAAECVRYVNNVLAKQSEGATFVTLVYGIMDVRTGEVDYCNAGHHHPYICSPRDGLKFANEGGGAMVGLFEGLAYEPATVQLKPGEGLLLYTDGVTEAFDASGRMFDQAGLTHAIETAHLGSSEDLVKNIMKAVRSFVAAAPQSDDMTVLAIRYLG